MGSGSSVWGLIHYGGGAHTSWGAPTLWGGLIHYGGCPCLYFWDRILLWWKWHGGGGVILEGSTHTYIGDTMSYMGAMWGVLIGLTQ